MYSYYCTVVRVIDGDTFVADIDLGFGICLLRKHIRIYGVNTPEVVGKTKDAGLKARNYLEEWLKLNASDLWIIVENKQDKYGRILARVYGIQSRNLAQNIIDDKVGVKFMDK